MQGVLCSVSFLKLVIQHQFGSSRKLYKCCILKRSEKFKPKAVQYTGARYCGQSGRHMKPEVLFGQVRVKAHRKPPETKSKDFSAGRLKQMVRMVGVRSLPSLGAALRGCAESPKSLLNPPTLKPPSNLSWPRSLKRLNGLTACGSGLGFLAFCAKYPQTSSLATYLW